MAVPVHDLPLGLVAGMLRIDHAIEPFHAFETEPGDVFLGGQPVRGLVRREVQAPELDFHVALLGHLQGAGNRIGEFGREPRHFVPALQVKLGRRVAHPLRIAHDRLGLEAEQHFVRFGVFALEIVDIVRGHDRQARLAGQFPQRPVHLALLGNAVIHELEIEPFGAEYFGILPGRADGAGHVVGCQVRGHLPLQAGRKTDQPLAVFGQQFLVNAGLVVKALQMREGHEPHQVVVAFVVPGQQHEVVVRIPLRLVPPLQAGFPGYVRLAPDKGAHLLLLAFLVEIHSPAHHAVVGHGHGPGLLGRGRGHQIHDAAGAVENAVLRVDVKMDKGSHDSRRYSSRAENGRKDY